MVDVVRVKPPARVRGQRFSEGSVQPSKPRNLKTSSRCRPAVDSAGGHFSDNHRSQDPQARKEGLTQLQNLALSF